MLFADSLYKFRQDHPESLKVAFLMTKFSKEKPYPQIFSILKEVYAESGIALLRADDKMYNPDLYTNIETYLHSCGSGIAFFDTMEQEDFNPNVALEVGYMMSLKKPVCLLKSKFNKTLQVDLMGKIYLTLNPLDIDAIREPVKEWLSNNDLCFNCTECYITLKEDLINHNAQPEKFKKIEDGLYAIKQPDHILKYKGISNNHDEKTTFSYECNTNFYNSIIHLFKGGALDKILGTPVLNISSTPDLGYKNYDYVWKIEDFVPEAGKEK
jgi:nucleoside 2-deoxyribosyltransferase